MKSTDLVPSLLKELGYRVDTEDDIIAATFDFVSLNNSTGGYPITNDQSFMLALRRAVDQKRMNSINFGKYRFALGFGIVAVGLLGAFMLGRRKRK